MRVAWRRRGSLCVVAALIFLCARASIAQELFPPINTTDVWNRKVVDEIYRGRFERISQIDPDKFIPASDELYAAQQLLTAFVTAYSDQCQHLLSPNKKEIKILMITYSQRTTVLQKGLLQIPLGTERTPISSKVVSTGVFADEPFYSLYGKIYDGSEMNAMVLTFRQITRNKGMTLGEAGLAVIGEMLRNHTDTHMLIARHGCDSKQIGTYMRNLANYVRGQPPAFVEPRFVHYCSAKIAEFMPGLDRSRCPCLRGVLKKRMFPERFFELEDGFTEEAFLAAVVSRVDLHKELVACVR